MLHSYLSKDCVLCASEDLSVDMPTHAQIPLSALLHVCCGAVRPDVTCPFGTMACGCSACPLLLVFAYVAVPLYQLAKLLQAWSVSDHHASQQTQQPKPHSGAAFSLRSAMSPPRCTNMSVRSTTVRLRRTGVKVGGFRAHTAVGRRRRLQWRNGICSRHQT